MTRTTLTTAAMFIATTLLAANAQEAHAQVGGLEQSMVVLELYLGDQKYPKTREYVDRVSDELDNTRKFSMLTRGDARRVMGGKMTQSGRKLTDDKLKEIEQMMKDGDRLLYTDPRQAIEILAKAKEQLKKIMESISLNQKIRQDFFKTQMMLARSHFDNENKTKASSILEEIIRIFGDEVQVTEADYHPNIVTLYRQAYRRLSNVKKGSVHVTTLPKGAEILIHGKPQKKASPATYTDLFPGSVSIQARFRGRESMIHKVIIEAGQTKELKIDIDFETSLAFNDKRFGFAFPDEDTMAKRVADFATRVGKQLNVDLVLCAGLVERDGRTVLQSYLVDVKDGTLKRQDTLLTKPNVVSNSRVVKLAKAIAGDTVIATVYKPWYHNWVGWTLAGVGIVGMAVGGVLWADFESKLEEVDCDEGPNCKSFNDRVNIAADAQTTRALSVTSFVVGSLLIAGSIPAFILMKEEDLEGGDDLGFRLKSLTPILTRDTAGVGAAFTF